MNNEHPVEDAFDLPVDAHEVPQEAYDDFLSKHMEILEALKALNDLSIQCLEEFFAKMKPSKSLTTWMALIKEEFKELVEAGEKHQAEPTIENAEALLKEAADLNYVVYGFQVLREMKNSDLDLTMHMRENLGMALQVTMDQLAALSGVSNHPNTLAEAMRRVHASNMSKLGDDGKPIKRADGKILKGPNYKPPVLTDIITG